MEQLSPGPQQTLTQSVVYALPARAVYLVAKDVCEVSVNNSDWAALAASTTGVIVSNGYIRCTGGNTTCYTKLQ